jgi:hypothetical protein
MNMPAPFNTFSGAIMLATIARWAHNLLLASIGLLTVTLVVWAV